MKIRRGQGDVAQSGDLENIFVARGLADHETAFVGRRQKSSAPGFSTTPKGAYMPAPMLMPLWQAEQPLSMNRASPDFCAGDSAPASPLRKRSNGALGVISVASKTAIAFCTFASVMGSGSPGKALAKASA